MGKYVVKRIAYMLVVLIILSFILYMIYSLVPANRAYTDARADIQGMKGTSAELDAKFEELYLQYQRQYGTDTDNKLIRYGRWIGIAPLYDGSYNGLLQGNLGFSYEYDKPVLEVIEAPMKNTIKINIYATILALGITIPLGKIGRAHV